MKNKKFTTVDKTKLSEESKHRRKLLGVIAAGGAAANLLPMKWSKPVVDSVLLPAHAEMSPGSLLSTFDCTVTGFLFNGSFSGSVFSPMTSSFSGNLVGDQPEFTFAVVTGSVSAVALFTGSAIASYTAFSSTSSQIAPFIFDSTCAG